MLKPIFYFCISAVIFITSSTQASTKADKIANSIKSSPMGKFVLSESNGISVLISENGRYIIKNPVITDLWTTSDIKTVGEAIKSSELIPIKKIVKDYRRLNIISFGKGQKSFFVFVDPQCAYCKTFVKSAQAYTAEYTFNLVVVPALGKESNKLSKSLFCAKDKTNALNSFLNDTISKMPQKPNCDTTGYDETLLLAQLMNIEGVPFFVSERGFYKQGADDTIWNWLKKTPSI